MPLVVKGDGSGKATSGNKGKRQYLKKPLFDPGANVGGGCGYSGCGYSGCGYSGCVQWVCTVL